MVAAPLHLVSSKKIEWNAGLAEAAADIVEATGFEAARATQVHEARSHIGAR
ncbi:MAG: hypothetical protein ABI421_08940 [Polyangiaceae bacterium]